MHDAGEPIHLVERPSVALSSMLADGMAMLVVESVPSIMYQDKAGMMGIEESAADGPISGVRCDSGGPI